MLEVSRGTDIKYYYVLDIILNIPYGDKTVEKPYSAVSGHGNTIYNPNISNTFGIYFIFFKLKIYTKIRIRFK